MNWYDEAGTYIDPVPTLVVSLEPLDRSGNCRVTYSKWIIVKSSPQPTLAAARWLYKDGVPEEVFLISVYAGEAFAVGQGAIGILRRLTVREDLKTGPRFVMRKRWPSSDVARRKREYEIRAGADYYDLSLAVEKSGATLPLRRPLFKNSELCSKRRRGERDPRSTECER